MIGYSNKTGLPSVTTVLKPFIDTGFFKPEHAQRGSHVHAMISAYLQGIWFSEDTPDDWQLYFESFLEWWRFRHYEIVLVEKRLIHSVFQYCGKMDLVVTDGKDNILIDFKTSQAKYSTWPIQLMAYAEMLKNNGVAVDRMACVRLKNDGSGVHFDEYKTKSEYWNTFLSALNCHRYFNG